MSDVISAMQEVSYALFQGYCLQYFMGAFLESRFAKQKWSGFMTAILFGVIKIGLRLRAPSNDESMEILKKQIALFLILFVLTFCFYQAFHIITVFLVITFMAVSEISFFLAYLVMEFGSLLFEFWNWCVGQAYITSVKTFEYVIKGTMNFNREKNSRIILENQIGSMQEHMTEMELLQAYGA